MEVVFEQVQEPISATSDEDGLDVGLRPSLLSDFIGQDDVKRNIDILIRAAQGRNESIEHVLLYGNPGLGKTTLAHIIAREMGVGIKVTSGPAIERVGDLAAILSNLQAGDILFIDEIHRLNHAIEEVLYPAMEDFALDIVIGKGPSAKTVRIDLPRFTLIGATTRVSMLSAPLRDRFGAVYHLGYYEPEHMEHIVRRTAGLLEIDPEDGAVKEIASRSRATPRIANRLLKRVRDFAQVLHGGALTREVAKQALDQLQVDTRGLDATDRKVLEVIIERFKGGPVGVAALAAATSEDVETIESVYEPYLMQIGFIERTPRGRIATKHAHEHLGYPAL